MDAVDLSPVKKVRLPFRRQLAAVGWTFLMSLVVAAVLFYIEYSNRKQSTEVLIQREQEMVQRLNELESLLSKDRNAWVEQLRKANPQLTIPEFKTLPRIHPKPPEQLKLEAEQNK